MSWALGQHRGDYSWNNAITAPAGDQRWLRDLVQPRIGCALTMIPTRQGRTLRLDPTQLGQESHQHPAVVEVAAFRPI